MSCYPLSRVDASQRLLKGTFQHLKVNFSPAHYSISIQSNPIQSNSTHTELNRVSDFPCSYDLYIQGIAAFVEKYITVWPISGYVLKVLFLVLFLASILHLVIPTRRSRLDPLISYKGFYNLIWFAQVKCIHEYNTVLLLQTRTEYIILFLEICTWHSLYVLYICT